MKKQKNKRQWLMPLLTILFIGSLSYIGFQQGSNLSESDAHPLISFIQLFVTASLAISVFFILHIIIHEAGHLISGKLSGYHFLFFRIFKWTLLKKDGKYTYTTLSIAGTGGQCLMLPPKNDPHPPYLLYLLGGVLANIITSLLALVIYTVWWPSYILLIFAVMGILSAAINGIPTGFNDGMMIKKIRENNTVRDQLMQQLEWTGKFTMGATYSDFENEQVIFNPEAALTEQSNVYGKLIEANASLEKEAFEDAQAILLPLWQKKAEIIGPYQIEVIREYVFSHLVLSQDKESDALIIDEALKNPFFKNYLSMKQADSYRMQATLAWFKEGDKETTHILISKAREVLENSPLEVDKKLNGLLLDVLENKIDA